MEPDCGVCTGILYRKWEIIRRFNVGFMIVVQGSPKMDSRVICKGTRTERLGKDSLAMYGLFMMVRQVPWHVSLSCAGHCGPIRKLSNSSY